MANPQQFYKRLNQLAGTSIKVNENNNIDKATLIDLERADDGMALGVIKENHSYFVKVSKKSGNNLSVADFAYIGGVQNVKDYQFSTLSEAQKQRNFKLRSLNEAFSLTGKANLLKEEVKKENPSLNIKDDIGSFLSKRIKQGKKNINENRETTFKGTLTKEKETIARKTGLLNEVALTAIQKALGKVNEDKSIIVADSEENPNDSVANKTNDPLNKTGKDLSTEDSEIKDSDEIANKTGKEASTAPINDTNAKTKADKAMGKDSVPAKPKSGKSISVNEGGDISTADSEISDGEILPNKKDKKDGAQAPINDTNAKTLADKNDVSEGNAISTEDSEQKDSDMIADATGNETPEAPYNSYNQPNKGYTDGAKKGEDLKPKKEKGAIVAEGDALSTEDSEANPADSIANKTNAAPKKSGESLIVADSELEPSKSLANDANGAPKKSGESLIVADSEMNPADSLANKTNIREGIGDDIEAAKEKVDDLDAADAQADAEIAPEPEMGDDAADIDIDGMDLDVGGDEEIPAEPEMGGEEEVVDADVELGDDLGGEEEVDIDAEPAADGEGDSMVKELEKLVGKIGHTAQQVELEPDKTKELFNSLIGSFKDDLAKIGADEGSAITDKIEKITAGEGEGVADEMPVDDMGGEELPPAEDAAGLEPEQNAAIDQQIDDLGEDTPTMVDGEPLGDDIAIELGIEGGEEEISMDDELEEGACNECGTFESYVQSKGVSLEECSGMEMADMISGYADAHKEGQNDGDFEGVAIYLGDPQVKQDVTDYGHEDYVAQAEPFIKNIGEGGVKFGMHEPMVGMAEDDEDPTDDASADIEDAVGVEIGDEEAPIDSIVPDETNVEIPAEDGMEDVLDLTNLPEKPEPTFGLGAEVMGGGVMKPETAAQKTVDVDLQTGKVIVTMNEEEKKLRKLIKYKLEEKFGKRKPSINENNKTKTSKLIDKMITEQLKVYEGVIGKKIGK